MERGFTLIEILIVLGLVGVIASFGVIMSYSSISRVNSSQERDLLVSLLLSGARAEALANIDEKDHGVHIQDDKYILFEGSSWGSATNKRDVIRNSVVKITGPSGILPPFDVIFTRLSGNVSAGDGTITLTGNGQSIDFTINKVGRINW